MKIFGSTFFLATLILCFCHPARSQEVPKNGDPFIISVIPDSLLKNYDYSQVVTFQAEASGFSDGSDIAAMDALKDKIKDKCKDDKWDGFLLQHTTFGPVTMKGFVVAWGTLLRRKKN